MHVGLGGFDGGGGDEFFKNAVHFRLGAAFGQFFGKGAHAVIIGRVGDMGFQNQRVSIAVAFDGIVDALVVVRQWVGRFHFQHAPLDFFGLAVGQNDFKGAHFVGQGGNAEILLPRAFAVFQTIPFADFRQRRFRALVGLHQARTGQMPPQEGHAAFDGRHTVSLDARQDVGAGLAVVLGAEGKKGDVLRLRRLGNDEMCAVQRLGVAAQHARIDQPRGKIAYRAVGVGNGREEFVVGAGERRADHQAAAVGGVGEALRGVDLQVLLRQFGFGHVCYTVMRLMVAR